LRYRTGAIMWTGFCRSGSKASTLISTRHSLACEPYR
jgi:hypothetical protein